MIYYWTGSGWQRVSGQLKHIDVASDGSIWGVSPNNHVYQRSGGKNGDWMWRPGRLMQISVGRAGDIWGVNSARSIYRWIGD